MRDSLMIVISLILIIILVLILLQLNANNPLLGQQVALRVPLLSKEAKVAPFRSGGRVNHNLIFYNRVNKCGSSTMNVLFQKGTNATFMTYPGYLNNRFITKTQQVKHPSANYRRNISPVFRSIVSVQVCSQHIKHARIQSLLATSLLF